MDDVVYGGVDVAIDNAADGVDAEVIDPAAVESREASLWSSVMACGAQDGDVEVGRHCAEDLSDVDGHVVPRRAHCLGVDTAERSSLEFVERLSSIFRSMYDSTWY